MDELVVFLMREFGWTFEYATNLVMTLELEKLNALVAETSYQKRVDEYILAQRLVAAMRGKGKSFSDLIGQPPTRDSISGGGNLREAAEKQGIILPKEGA